MFLGELGYCHPQHAWFVRCSRPVFSKGVRRPLVYYFPVSNCLLDFAVCVCCSMLCFFFMFESHYTIPALYNKSNSSRFPLTLSIWVPPNMSEGGGEKVFADGLRV